MQSLHKIALTAGLLFLSAGNVTAQDKPSISEPQKPAIAQTRANDPVYEGLITASKLLSKNDALEKATRDSAGLFDKQAAMDDPKVKESLKLLTNWLDQNAVPSVELSYTLDSFDPLFAQFGSFIQMAKTLEAKQYTQLAEGRVSDAIDTTRDGLRLAVSLENHSLGGCQEGFKIEDAVIMPLATHLDQLAMPDCSRLIRLSHDWEKTPNAILYALNRERRAWMQATGRLSGEDGKKIRAMLQQIPDDAAKPDTDESKMLAQLKSLDDKKWLDLVKRTANGIDQIFTKATLDMQTPIYKRGAPEKFNTTKDIVGNIEGLLASGVSPQITKMETDYVKRQAYAHLLGCHAAIRQFHWENNRWPATLSELKVDELAKDPFSGASLVYKLDKDSYALSSVGAPVYDKDGKLDEAARVAITLPEKVK